MLSSAKARELYSLLEKVVAPCFYDRDERGIARGWVAHMRASMSELVPRFSTSRAVREYTEELYLPAARAYRERAANGGKLGARLLAERQKLIENWSSLHFGSVRVDSREDRHFFRVQVYLGDLDQELVRIELYADGLGGAAGAVYPMERTEAMPGRRECLHLYRTGRRRPRLRVTTRRGPCPCRREHASPLNSR